MIAVTGHCMACGALVDRMLCEVTTLGDPQPRFMPGAWDACCGYLVQTRAPCMGPMQGPPVPTPDDILRSAGHRLL